MATDKDRLGEKLRDKQRGDEDRYFAQQDKEKLEALKKDSDAPLGLCPRCGVQLEETVRKEVTIDVCRDCGGVWLDRGELETLSERSEEGWASSWLRSMLCDSE